MKKTSLILFLALFTMVSFCQTRVNNGLIIGRKTSSTAVKIDSVSSNGTNIKFYKGSSVLNPTTADTVSFSSIGVYKADSINPTAGSYTPRYDFEYQNPMNDMLYSLKLLGSDLKGLPVNPVVPTSYTNLTDSTVLFTQIFIPRAGLITGIHTGAGNVTGNYVASSTGFNGVGLYTSNGTTLTAVAQSTNDKAHLTTPAYEGKNIPFITPYQANAGVYWVAIYYNMNSATVVPQVIATTSFYANHANLYKAVSTGSYVFVSAKKANVATFQSTFTITTLTGDNVTYFVAPY